jgi:hypothetical protein
MSRLLVLLLILGASALPAQPSHNPTSVGSNGGISTAPEIVLQSSLGESIVGVSSKGSVRISSGYLSPATVFATGWSLR